MESQLFAEFELIWWFIVRLLQEKGTKRRRSGLLPDHPYCVTGLARVRTTQSGIDSQTGMNALHDTNLVRLRSPWAGSEYGGVWGGAWSERSWEWNALSDRDRELLASRSQHEGEFWYVKTNATFINWLRIRNMEVCKVYFVKVFA